jgi:hypothetical protein
MRILRLFVFAGLAAAAAACSSQDTDGEVVTLDPLAGLRYVNLVSDTSAMDFRVIDIVGDAPNTIAASFRTGGSPFGIANPVPTQPPYHPVRAGTRQIRVFMNGSTAAVASQVVFDTTVTLAAGSNYTFYLFGSARTAGGVHSRLTEDVVPASAIAAGKFGLRVVHLAPTLASSVNTPGNLQAPLDVFVTRTDAPVPPTGAASFTNVAFGEVRPYVTFDTSTSAATGSPYRIAATVAGTTTPALAVGTMPVGARGTSTQNPAAGTHVAGTVITAVIVSRSEPGTQAPAAPATRAITTITRSNDTVTVTAGTAHNLAVGNVVTISGATQAEYNGVHSVIAVPSTTVYRFRVAGTPATPATGTPVFRINESGVLKAQDYATPAIFFLVDQNPPRTAP